MEQDKPQAQDALDDPGVVVFQGKTRLEPGEVQLHKRRIAGVGDNLFGRSLDDVKADWKKVSGQIKEILENAIPDAPGGFTFESVEVSLGFSAEGKIIFIAEAGVEASITVTFKRAAQGGA